jgi:hypothetical protein
MGLLPKPSCWLFLTRADYALDHTAFDLAFDGHVLKGISFLVKLMDAFRSQLMESILLPPHTMAGSPSGHVSVGKCKSSTPPKSNLSRSLQIASYPMLL